MVLLNLASALQLDQLQSDDLEALAHACRCYSSQDPKSAKEFLDWLFTRDLPEPVLSLVDSLNKVIAGYQNAFYAESTTVAYFGLEDKSKITVKQAIEIVISHDDSYIAARRLEQQARFQEEKLKEKMRIAAQAELRQKIQSLLNHTERGIRLHWQCSDHEIARLIQSPDCASEANAVKRSMALSWLKSHRFRPPTDEQLDFIIDTHHSIRVTARAGSGKTETVATKILFLLHFIGLAPDHILALVFNVEARDDLIHRISDLERKAGLPSKGPYAVMNFDRLARGVVQPQANILKGTELSKKIKEIVHFFLSEQSGHSELIQQFMLTSFQADWNKWLLNNERYSLDQLGKLRGLLMEEAIDGTSVKSKGEKRIADFLFEHNITYKYEYPWRTDRGVVIYPDFYLPQFKLVIEYWGMAGDKDYDDAADFKRRYWDSKPGYTLIEIFPHHLSGLSPDFLQGRDDDYQTIADIIKQTLAENGCIDIELDRLSDEELLDKLKKRLELEFEKLLITALTRLSQCCRTNADVVTLVSRYRTEEAAERMFVDLLPVIDQTYRDLLSASQATDFAQLKWDCIDLLQQGISSFTVERGTVRVHPDRLRYIFIDEFQDFSELYQAIVQSLLQHSDDAVVNAVGDDWQMINRFAGSDLSLFESFSDTFPRPRELTLTTNFRSSPQVVKFCNAVMDGLGAPAQVAEHLTNVKGRVAQVSLSNLKLTDAEEHYFKGDPTISSLLRLIPACTKRLNFKELTDELKANNQNAEALKPFFYVLTRTNYPKGLKVGKQDFGFLKAGTGSGLSFLDAFLVSVYTNELLPTSVRALTVHRSKGKEAEVVFLLAPEQYPLIHPTSCFLGIFGDDLCTIIDDERRLFYVACSRARQQLYLLTFASEKIPDFLPKHFTDHFTWSDAPYVRKIPDGIYKIEIANQNDERNALYINTPRLRDELGFSYANENGIPIRWQQVEECLQEVARYMVELVEEFRETKLHFTLFDAAGGICFQWPGPVDPLDYLAACQASESRSQAHSSKRTVGRTSEEELHVDPLCSSIYDYFLDPRNGLQHFKPSTGFELMQSGLVVAEAELAWPKQKAAIVITEEDYEQFTDNDWRVWIATSDGDEQSDHMELVELPAVMAYLRSVTQATS